MKKYQATVRYPTNYNIPKDHKDYAMDSLRRSFGVGLYENITKDFPTGKNNYLRLRLIEEEYPVRILSPNGDEYVDYLRFRAGDLAIPSEWVTEREFRIVAEVEPIPYFTYHISKLDYNFKESSMPKWLKWILQRLYPDG